MVQIPESKEFSSLAPPKVVTRTMTNLKERGVICEYVESGKKALERIKELIPKGAQVNAGGSETLAEIGFVDLLKSGKHPWKNVKEAILKEKDPKLQSDLRKRAVLSDYWLGSVHAIAETGEIVVASATGSQIPAYAYTSDNIIWVAGTQKIMSSLEAATRRVREYVFPLEDLRMKEDGFSGSAIAKILIFEREVFSQRLVRLILVNEKLGF